MYHNNRKVLPPVEEAMKDPLLNPNLPLPSCETLKQRLLAHPVLQAYFRPDIKTEYWLCRPSDEEMNKALRETMDGLVSASIWRLARDCGIWWNGRANDWVLLRDIALHLFTGFTDSS
jgi:hypothetical protein